MNHYRIGCLHGTRTPFNIPRASFDTHWHLIGGTGKGKTTAIHTILHQLLLDPTHEPCVVVIDRLGNLSFELLLWMASEFCTEDVRRRLLYIEPAREDVVIPFNPLLYDTLAHGYYKVARAAEIILKGWASQNLEEMPRLARWLFNCFWAAAQLGLTIADCIYFLIPRSRHHREFLKCLPELLQVEWSDLTQGHPAEVGRLLESARNRLKPYFESPILRHMFGASVNRMDVFRFMREGRIVLVNLAPANRLPAQVADAIGGLLLNEIFTTARSLPPHLRHPTYVYLDEFQRFVGPDLEAAIPEVRQLDIKLLMSHQSMSQLKQGTYDLTSIIFQAQSRMIFGLQGEDADLMAHELASIEADPKRIKDEVYASRQRLAGHTIIPLHNWSQSNAQAQQWSHDYGTNWSARDSLARRSGHPGDDVRTRGSDSGASRRSGESHGSTDTTSHGTGEHVLPVHEDFLELVRRTYYTFDEDLRVWGRKIRNAKRGTAFIRLVEQPQLYHVDIKRSAPGHLGCDHMTLIHEFPEAIEEVQRLVEQNFSSDFFVSPSVIEADTQARIERVLNIANSLDRPAQLPHSSRHSPPDANPFFS